MALGGLVEEEEPRPPLEGPLSTEDLLHFRRRGWCVLREAMPTDEATAFTRDLLLPAVLAAGVDPDMPETWHTGEKYHAVWDRSRANDNRYGAHVGLGGDGVAPPRALFARDGRLNRAAAQLLTSADGESGGSGECSGRRRPGFVPYGEEERIGGVVVRYPLKRRRDRCWSDRCWPRSSIGLPRLGWHIDGVHHHHLHSGGIALITLPVFGLGMIARGCGMTAVVSGSHEVVADRLVAAHPQGLSHMRLFLLSHLLAWSTWLPACVRGMLLGRRARGLILEEVAPCAPGDVLLMHPLLAHSSAENVQGDTLRLASNKHVSWDQDLDLGPFRGSAGSHCGASVSEVERVHADAILRRRLRGRAPAG